MDWYYVEKGVRVGPVSQAAFEELVAAGKVKTDTLVWHAEMPDWQPYGNVSGTTPADNDRQPASDPAGSGAARCSECGRSFSREEMIRYKDNWVCAACKPIFVQKLKEGMNVSGNFVYAGFWIRFAAKFIDGIIVGVVYLLIFIPATIMIAKSRPDDPAQMMPFAAIQIALMALQYGIDIFYKTWFIGRYAATPGKMACKIKVVMPDGGRVSYLRAFGRYFAEIVSGITLGIGYIMAAFDSEKRALHDRMCATRVVTK